MAKQNEELLLLAFEKQKEYYFKLSHKNETNKSILYFAAFCIAVEEIYHSIASQKRKNKVLNLDDIKDTTKIQAKQFKQSRKSETYDKLLNLKSKIIALIEEENLSFRQVSLFLKKYHKFEVSHSYIATFYKKMKVKK